MRNCVSIAIGCIAVWMAGWPSWGQTKEKFTPPKELPSSKATQPRELQRGSKESPIFIYIEQDPQGQSNATNTGNAVQHKDFYDKLGAWGGAAAAFFSFLLVIVGWCGVKAALRTLQAIERQANLMGKDFRISNRAFLSLGDKLEPPTNNRASFPIENTGRVPALLKSAEIEVIERLSGIHRTWTNTIPLKESVVPGKNAAFELSVTLPPEALTDSEGVLVAITIKYDIGFGDETDACNFVRVYRTPRQEWVIARSYEETKVAEDKNDQWPKQPN
jgi:hypothetical protein